MIVAALLVAFFGTEVGFDEPAAKPAAAPRRVVLTQYTESIGSRYGIPAGTPFDPYTQALPAAVPPAAPPLATGPAGVAPTAAPVSGGWNPEAVAPAPSGWNGGGVSVADASPMQQLSAAVQQATEPVRDSFDRVDQQVRGAADALNGRTQQLLDQLRSGSGGALPGAAPPASAPLAGGEAPSGWNGGAGDATAAPQLGASGWNMGEAPPLAGPAGAALPPAAEAPSGWNLEHDTTPPVVGGAPLAGPPVIAAPPSVDNDPWARAADPALRPGGGATGASSADTAPPLLAGPDLGDLGDPAPGFGPVLGPAGQGRPAAASGVGGVPAITSGMLAESPLRPLEDLAADAGGGSLLAGGTSFGPSATPPTPPAGESRPAATDGSNRNERQETAAATDGSEARYRAAVILAWILLFGSVAGNMYLFWSYLDVRTKYRALVRKTARAVGSRFSAT